jgi:sugar O-acyltransferase (sialic acid O-acetyltransferase NeuD family)
MQIKEKLRKLVIIGTGETAEIAFDYFTYDSEYEVAAFALSETYINSEKFLNLPIAKIETLEKTFSIGDYDCFIAISSNHLNRDRTNIYSDIKNKGYKIASYVSSKAFVWRNVKIGDNCFIFENNVIQSNVEIGNNVTLWSGNHIGHRSIIRDNCFISSHVVISGFCEIGENTFMGVNSCVANNIKIAKDNFIAMGAVISKDTQENKIYKGNPAESSSVDAKKYCKVKD